MEAGKVPRLALLAAGALDSTRAVEWAPGGAVTGPRLT